MCRPSRTAARCSVTLALLTAACGASSASSGHDHATLSESQWHESVRQPHDRDIIVQTSAPTPIGPLHADHANAYVVRVALVNGSQDPIETWAVWVRTSVYRDGQLVDGCTSEAQRASAAPRALGPGGSIVVAVASPCAIEEPGSYEIVGSLDVDEPSAPGEGALVVAEGSSAQQIVVDGSLAPFAGP